MSKDTSTGMELSAEQDVRPCKHMEQMVSGYADGSLKGPARWYTQFHVMHCSQCRAAAKNLESVIVRVSELRDAGPGADTRLPADRRAEIDRALDEVDDSARARE